MPIVNQENLDRSIKANQDPYGKAVIDIAIKVMQYLDEDPTPLHRGYNPDIHTPHGLICKADEELNLGISGFQAGCVKSVIGFSHSRGKEFADNY
ncbi:MAG: hypothetical protein EOM67_15430 [Spirochaetia bacterium]|nr:hypothetical protein [Spirochaetia bacterium]